jgi:hypothetical protein
MVVFKCSMMTSSVWGNIATYFWGLLGIDGCIEMFGGVGTWLRFCFSIVCLSSFVPFGRRVAWLCVSAYISHLVGSMVGFLLLIFHVWFWTFLLV